MLVKESMKDYRANPAISRSELFLFSDCPARYKYEKEHTSEQTPSLIIGQAFHKLVLEPEMFNDEFAVEPECDRRTKEGKEIYADFAFNAVGKTLISADTYKTICGMRDSILNEPTANKMLNLACKNGRIETSIYWTDKDSGETVKCRPDALFKGKDKGYIIDLKSCNSARQEEFSRDMHKYGYDLQAAHYKEGAEQEFNMPFDFIFIAVEKTPPFLINVLRAKPEVLEIGKLAFRQYISMFKQCKDTNDWFGYMGEFNEPLDITLPAWILKEYGKGE